MEATQGDATAVRFLFKKALQANPRSRYAHLAWALWERKQGNAKQCVALLRRGQALNPTDPALYQARAVFIVACCVARCVPPLQALARTSNRFLFFPRECRPGDSIPEHPP